MCFSHVLQIAWMRKVLNRIRNFIQWMLKVITTSLRHFWIAFSSNFDISENVGIICMMCCFQVSKKVDFSGNATIINFGCWKMLFGTFLACSMLMKSICKYFGKLDVIPIWTYTRHDGSWFWQHVVPDINLRKLSFSPIMPVSVWLLQSQPFLQFSKFGD